MQKLSSNEKKKLLRLLWNEKQTWGQDQTVINKQYETLKNSSTFQIAGLVTKNSYPPPS